jgi:hypothetical protein
MGRIFADPWCVIGSVLVGTLYSLELMKYSWLAVALGVFCFPIGAGAQEGDGGSQFNIEVRAPFSYKLPTDEPSALAYGAEIFYYVTPQVHSEKYRSFFAEEVSANRSSYHFAGYYEPRSDLCSARLYARSAGSSVWEDLPATAHPI